jgi:hypothetical protein
MTQVAAAVDRESRGSGVGVPRRLWVFRRSAARPGVDPHEQAGKTSGLELGQMQTNNAALFHVRNGKVARLGVYWDRERALTELWREGQEGWARDS